MLQFVALWPRFGYSSGKIKPRLSIITSILKHLGRIKHKMQLHQRTSFRVVELLAINSVYFTRLVNFND